MEGFKKILALASVGTILIAANGAANAAAYCSAGSPHPDGLSTSDVNYSETGVAPFTNSNDCYGVVLGNVNSAADVQNIWGTGWVLGDGTDTASGQASLFGGLFTFTVTANAGTTGTYTLTATDDNGAAVPNFPLSLDFIVALKASDRYALYFFDNVTFDGAGGGQWTITFKNNGGQIPNISHLQVYVREGTGTCCRDVPEPGTLGLMGFGLLGLALGRRRLNKFMSH